MEEWTVEYRPTQLRQGNKSICTFNQIGGQTNANLVLTAVNACISVNESNPLAVAQNIKAMYEALQCARYSLQTGFETKSAINKAKQVLSQIESKEAK